ncbi:MAG TPA: CocE/NonD family hydrolase [Ktedonobacterales bacterium]
MPTLRPAILFDQRVPMRDTVTLSADVYLPSEAQDGGQVPAVLMRTPYVKSQEAQLEVGRAFARAGYAYVAMDVRGRGDSDGVFVPYFNDGLDGYDAIEWLATQAWCDGKVGTIGASYPGRIQWLTAVLQPLHLAAMISIVTPSDPFVETPTGLPGPQHLCWLHYTSGRVNQPMESVEWAQVYDHLPLLTMDERTGREIPRWREDVRHARLDDYWQAICYQDKFAQVRVPVFHISGWYDDEQIGTPLNFLGMTTQGPTSEVRAAQRLLMGPWGHRVNTTSKLGEVDFGPQSLIDLRGEQIRFFDTHLRGNADDRPPARIFVMGENVWRDEHEWPLARTEWLRFYLRSEGSANSRYGDGWLSVELPFGDHLPSGYTYDPARPVPFITEATSSQIGGPDDYAAVQRRDDVLVYVTEALGQPLEVTGPVTVELYVSSSAPDTDFTAMLFDVHPSGFAQRLCDGMVRMRFRDGFEEPSLIEREKVYKITIECWNTSHVFQHRHAIGVQIASSAFPKFDRNLNTGEELGTTTGMLAAEQQVFADEEHPSCVILPLIPR